MFEVTSCPWCRAAGHSRLHPEVDPSTKGWSSRWELGARGSCVLGPRDARGCRLVALSVRFPCTIFCFAVGRREVFLYSRIVGKPRSARTPHFVRSSSLPKTFLQLRFVAGKLPSCLSAQSLAARSFAEGGILPKSCKKRMMITGKPPSIIYFLAAIVYPTIVLRALADISASINGNKTPGSSLRSLTLRLPFTELKWYRERIFVSPGSGNH